MELGHLFSFCRSAVRRSLPYSRLDVLGADHTTCESYEDDLKCLTGLISTPSRRVWRDYDHISDVCLCCSLFVYKYTATATTATTTINIFLFFCLFVLSAICGDEKCQLQAVFLYCFDLKNKQTKNCFFFLEELEDPTSTHPYPHLSVQERSKVKLTLRAR